MTKRTTSKAVAALLAEVDFQDARPRICPDGAMKYQALIALSRGEEVVRDDTAKKGPVWTFGPLRQVIPEKSITLLQRQGLVIARRRDDGVLSFEMTPQGVEIAKFANERFPDGVAYPTLKYIVTQDDVREDAAFRLAYGADQFDAEEKAARRKKVAA